MFLMYYCMCPAQLNASSDIPIARYMYTALCGKDGGNRMSIRLGLPPYNFWVTCIMYMWGKKNINNDYVAKVVCLWVLCMAQLWLLWSFSHTLSIGHHFEPAASLHRKYYCTSNEPIMILPLTGFISWWCFATCWGFDQYMYLYHLSWSQISL